jgi:hypothetical protein
MKGAQLTTCLKRSPLVSKNLSPLRRGYREVQYANASWG